ncbi:MAG: hypothetical protein JXN59_11035 [Anaerolineae bacterium]|nr:hypothetical protein [Anaerolineae bacterium]
MRRVNVRWLSVGLVILLLAMPAVALAQGGPELLAWQVDGPPDRPEGAGSLFWMAGEEPALLAPVPDEGPGTRALLCGPEALVADGSAAMIFAGSERGGLYSLPLDGAGELARLGNAHVLACVGAGRAMSSPDGTRWAYIDYPADETRSGSFANGTLRVLALPDGAESDTFADVVAFALADSVIYTVQFFTNARNLADEAVLTAWDGSAGREWAALAPAEGCDWTSAALDVEAASGKVALSLGEHCPGGSQWRLFSLEDGNPPVEHVYMPSGGAFLPASLINHVMFLEGGQQVLATFPNGRAATVANLVLVSLEDNTITLVTEGVTVDSAPGGRARHLRLSPDGRFLAYVSSTANNEHFLHRLALDGSIEPVTISAGPRGDAISMFAWRPDGGLAFVAGGVDGQNNSLFLLPAGEDEAQRVARGNFLRDSGVATDSAVMLLEHVEPDDDYRQPAANLVQVGFDGARVVLVEGREAAATAYPLLARQAAASE